MYGIISYVSSLSRASRPIGLPTIASSRSGGVARASARPASRTAADRRHRTAPAADTATGRGTAARTAPAASSPAAEAGVSARAGRRGADRGGKSA